MRVSFAATALERWTSALRRTLRGGGSTEWVRCNLCGGRRSSPVCEKKGLQVVRCDRCRLVFVNPRLTEAEILRRYSAAYFREEYLPALQQHWQAHCDHFLNICRSLGALAPAAQPFRLLDLGCGSGALLHIARDQLGWDVAGIEFNAEAVAYARSEHGLDTVRQGDLYSVKLPREHFQAVVLADLIEHVRDPSRLLQRVATWLCPQGIAFISTPNIDSESFRRLGAEWDMIGPDEHLYYFSRETLTALLERCGFSCAEFYYNNDDRDAMFVFARKTPPTARP